MADVGPDTQAGEGQDAARPARAVFRKRHRLGHNREFQAVYAAKVRKARGPIAVFGIPNDLGHARLGLSVGRPVGPAVVRNRVKRLLREAFRLEQCAAALPAGLDLVVTVRPHRAMTLTAYRRLLVDLAREVEREWERRRRRDERAEGVGGVGGVGG
jgi:ribonuclease P protein component